MTDGFTDALYRGLPDDTIWSRIRDQMDEAALRAFLHRHGGRLVASARAHTANDATANDAVQEAMIRLVRHHDRLPTHGAAMAWLYRVVSRTAMQFHRSERRRKAREAVFGSGRPEGVSPPELPATDVASAVRVAVAALPERERRVVELVYFEGMTHESAAVALGWSRGTVGTYVSRALKRLESILAGRGVTAVGVVAALVMSRASAGSPLKVAEIAAVALAAPAAAWRLSPAWALVAGAMSLSAIGATVWKSDAPVSPPAHASEPMRVFEPPPAVGREANNLRAFDTHVRDRLQDALDDMIGDGGRAEITSVRAFVTQLIVTATVTHGKRSRPPLKVWLAVETVDLNTYLLADVDGPGGSRLGACRRECTGEAETVDRRPCPSGARPRQVERGRRERHPPRLPWWSARDQHGRCRWRSGFHRRIGVPVHPDFHGRRLSWAAQQRVAITVERVHFQRFRRPVTDPNDRADVQLPAEAVPPVASAATNPARRVVPPWCRAATALPRRAVR